MEMSSYRWGLYGIDRLVELQELEIGEFEERLNVEDVVEVKEYESLDETGEFVRSDEDVVRYNCIKLYCHSWHVVIVNCESRGNGVMAICFADNDLRDTFLSMFKSMIGCVCWPLYFNWDNKLDILDSLVDSEHWYDMILNFDGNSGNSEENRLNRWTITINKIDCETIGKTIGKTIDKTIDKTIGKTYSKSIIPYIESISGIRFVKSMNRSIILRTYLTIRNRDIITIRRSIPISLIISQFR